MICLLQYVKSVHRTAENIAAALHPSVAADSQLAAVKEALRELEAAHMVRRGDDGYRIPTPAEDDWERLRNGISPKPGDAHRLYSEVLSARSGSRSRRTRSSTPRPSRPASPSTAARSSTAT